ncbi:hypothetical protein B7992_16120 [Fibrobacter sp. UWH1]|nr:hypothetical protein B7992_16120 [Fibrobacter sp. UWH1]
MAQQPIQERAIQQQIQGRVIQQPILGRAIQQPIRERATQQLIQGRRMIPLPTLRLICSISKNLFKFRQEQNFTLYAQGLFQIRGGVPMSLYSLQVPPCHNSAILRKTAPQAKSFNPKTTNIVF